MKYEDYFNPRYKPKKSDLVCTFKISPCNKRSAGAVAAESSTGTWTTLTTSTEKRMLDLGAKVISIKGSLVKIAYPIELFEKGNIPQLLSSIAGNVFGMKEVNTLRLEDIEFSKAYVSGFKGPEIGLNDIRKMINVKKRCLVGTIVKPKLGLTSEEHAKVAYESWSGGLDIVKCDENLTSQNFNRFERNIKLTLRMKERVERETGERKIYVPNVTAETNEMIKRAKMVKEEGGECVMIDILTTGWSALQTLRNENLGLIIHGHRAGHAMFTRTTNHGMSMLTIAKLARLIGVSQLHIGTANVGKMESGEDETQRINDFLKSRWFEIKPTFPIASGGLHAGSMPKLVKLLGQNIIVQAGGGCHGHPMGTRAGAASLRQAADAISKEISLKEYAKTHEELRSVIHKWGIAR